MEFGRCHPERMHRHRGIEQADSEAGERPAYDDDAAGDVRLRAEQRDEDSEKLDESTRDGELCTLVRKRDTAGNARTDCPGHRADCEHDARLCRIPSMYLLK